MNNDQQNKDANDALSKINHILASAAISTIRDVVIWLVLSVGARDLWNSSIPFITRNHAPNISFSVALSLLGLFWVCGRMWAMGAGGGYVASIKDALDFIIPKSSLVKNSDEQ